jgi:hypothetical protein
MSAIQTPKAKGLAKVPMCACCTTTPAVLRDDELGGAVCGECAAYGHDATRRLARAGIVGCARPVGPEGEPHRRDGRAA